MPVHTLFTRFLGKLVVPHTTAWCDKAFETMTFKSLYGLSHLLTLCGVPNKGMKFTDKAKITEIATPFLAQMSNGTFVIVTDMTDTTVTYDSRGATLQIDLQDFLKAWNGIVLLAFPDKNSHEPDYSSHHLAEIVERLSKYLLVISGVFLFCYFFISRQLYSQISTILLVFFNCCGLYFSWLLMQKSLNIHTAASDKVCGVLEQGGCDSIMEMKVSKLFGVISWSEVGFGYFSISLATLLLFPEHIASLALCNVCCLPYTFWSIWYQRFRAHHWCTLCVGVQTTLWLLFFSYLANEAFKDCLPPSPIIIVLGTTYLFVILFLNNILTILKNLPCHEKDS